MNAFELHLRECLGMKAGVSGAKCQFADDPLAFCAPCLKTIFLKPKP